MTPALIPRASLARLAAGPFTLVLALGALAVAEGPGRFTTYAGQSGLAATLTVVAGLALVAAGLITALGHRQEGSVNWLYSGLVWSAPVWVGWEEGPRWSGASACLPPASLPCWLHLVVAYKVAD